MTTFNSLPPEIVDYSLPYFLKINRNGKDLFPDFNFFPDFRSYEVFQNFVSTQFHFLSRWCADTKSTLRQLVHPHIVQIQHPMHIFSDTDLNVSLLDRRNTNGSSIDHSDRMSILSAVVQAMKSLGIDAQNRVYTCEEVANLAQTIEDRALETIWPKIAEQIQLTNPTIPFDFAMSAPEIRVWMDKNQHLLQGITRLFLDDLKLYCIPKEIKYFIGLQILDISKNKIQKLPDEISELINLIMLNLGENQLTSLPNNCKGCFPNLQTLYLNNNKLTFLPDNWAGNFTHLQSLRLNNNQLTSLPNNWLGNMNQLRFLHLEYNQLTSPPNGIENLNQIHLILLIGNPILFVSEAILGSNHMRWESTTLQYRSELATSASSPLGKLYQAILRRDDAEAQRLLRQLQSDDDKHLIYECVWIYAGKPKTRNLQWGEHNVFHDMHVFYRAVREAICLKLSRKYLNQKHYIELLTNYNLTQIADEMANLDELTQNSSFLGKLYQSILRRDDSEARRLLEQSHNDDDKNLIYECVWISAGRPITSDLKWGEHTVFHDMDTFYRAVQMAISIKRHNQGRQ